MYDFVTLGAYTKDTIVRPTGITQVDGGGYNYAALAAAIAGIKVAAITKLAASDRTVTQPLRDLGMDVFVHESRHSTCMRLEYPTANPDQRRLSVTTVVDPFVAGDVAGVDARAFLVSASFRGEAPLDLLKAIKSKNALLGVDIQGFVRIVDPQGELRYEGQWPERAAVLALVDILKTDAVEAEALTGKSDIHAAARALVELGPREIVLTHKSGLLVLADGRFHEQPFLPELLRGRSGRGDTCIGAYISKRLHATPEDATRWAAAVTSLKLEAEGPIRRTRAEVEAYLDRHDQR